MNLDVIKITLSAFLLCLLAATILSCSDSTVGDNDSQGYVIPEHTSITEAFDKGISKEKTEVGIDIFVLKGCHKCHKTQGKIKTIGPVMTGIKDRMTIAEMEAWIRHPRRLKPKTLMPMWDGNDDELISLIAYLRTL